jgi:hypothetical protein
MTSFRTVGTPPALILGTGRIAQNEQQPAADKPRTDNGYARMIGPHIGTPPAWRKILKIA